MVQLHHLKAPMEHLFTPSRRAANKKLHFLFLTQKITAYIGLCSSAQPRPQITGTVRRDIPHIAAASGPSQRCLRWLIRSGKGEPSRQEE